MKFIIILFFFIYKVISPEPYPIKFIEDDYNHNYLINIPSQSSEITSDNIAVFIFTDYFVIWIQGSSPKPTTRFYPENIQNYKNMRSLNIGRDYEIWENFIKPIKNGTHPSITKKRNSDNSYIVKISFPKAAIDNDRFLKVHKLYSSSNELVSAKIDYRMRLPANPHYVRRTLKRKDGNNVDIFTVADENSTYIKDMNNALDSNDRELIQNDTMSTISLLTSDDYNYTLLNFDEPKTDKTRLYHLKDE